MTTSACGGFQNTLEFFGSGRTDREQRSRSLERLTRVLRGDFRVLLLLNFFENDMFSQFLAVLLKFNLPLNLATIFAGPIDFAGLLVFYLN